MVSGCVAVVAASISTVVVSVVTTLATNALTNDPDIDLETANGFFRDHYAKVFDPQQIRAAWDEDYTDNYRKYTLGSYENYRKRYQEKFGAIAVKNVEPVTGQTNQFSIRTQATERGKASPNPLRSYIVFLECEDQWARLPGRSCAPDLIKIHVFLDNPSRAGS